MLLFFRIDVRLSKKKRAVYTYQYTIFRKKKSRWIPVAAEHIDYDTVIAEPIIDTILYIPPTLVSNIHQYIHSHFPQLRSIFQYSNFLDAGMLIANAISSNAAISVTDASVSQLSRTATVSCIITDRRSNMYGEGLVICPSLYHSCDSYGSELFRIYCVLVMIHVVTKFHNIRHGSLIIACDNNASLDFKITST